MITYCWVFVLGIVVLSCTAMTEHDEATGTRRIVNKQPQFRNKRSMDLRFKNNITMYYTIDSRFSTSQKNYILDKLKKVNALGCVQWVPSVPEEAITVKFLLNDTECRTYQWSIYNATTTNLNDHCFNDGLVMHEMGHAMGFQHEHQRRDRDCYLEVDPSLATNPNYKINPNIETSFPYDWKSFMHYRQGTDLRIRREFFENQHDQLGTYEELSQMDVIKLNYYYCGGPHYCNMHRDECKRQKEFIKSNNCSK